MTTNEMAIATAVMGSSTISALITVALNWRVNQKLEKLKIDLERGLYVTKAHYDLELASFRDLWSALSDLRLKVRAFRGPEKFQLITPDGLDQGWVESSISGVIKDFFAAHDNAVRVVLNAAPFYPEKIKKAAERTFDTDLLIIQRLSNVDGTFLSTEWLAELKVHSMTIDKLVFDVEMLIRSRLETLRIIQ